MTRLFGHLGIVVLVICCVLIGLRHRTNDRRHFAPPHIHPTDPESSCGPVAVAVAVRLMGNETSISEINDLIQLPPSGATSMLDLKLAIENIGFDVLAIQCDPDQRIPRRDGPLIIHLLHDHFVTLLPIDDTRSVLIDPPRSPQIVANAELRRNWGGAALVVSEAARSSVRRSLIQ